MATADGESQGDGTQADNESFKRLREAVGTLLLDSQASTAIVFTSALEKHLRIPMAAKMTIMNSQPVRGLRSARWGASLNRRRTPIIFSLCASLRSSDPLGQSRTVAPLADPELNDDLTW
jgi:hypothetical protein